MFTECKFTVATISAAQPLVIDDPFTEAQKRQLEEALHFQNALVDLLGEPTEKLEPWALAKIKAMQDALATIPRRPDDEIREEIARLTGMIDETHRDGGAHFAMLTRREAMQWVLNEQEEPKSPPDSRDEALRLAREWRARSEKAERERDDLAKKVYVPGLWKCAKCGFTLVQRVLRASDGAVGVRDEAGENCPNDGSPLWRVSERDAGNELADRAQEYLERAIKAERERDEARKDKTWWKEEAANQECHRDDAREDAATLRALIARAVETIEPFNALTPSDDDRTDNTVVLIPVYLHGLRRLATLAADLRKANAKV